MMLPYGELSESCSHTRSNGCDHTDRTQYVFTYPDAGGNGVLFVEARVSYDKEGTNSRYAREGNYDFTSIQLDVEVKMLLPDSRSEVRHESIHFDNGRHALTVEDIEQRVDDVVSKQLSARGCNG